MSSLREGVIPQFGHPRRVVCDNSGSFILTEIKSFRLEQEITWHTMLDYDHMSNKKAESMVGTMKKSVAKMVLNGSSDLEEAFRTAVYGYRMRSRRGQKSHFEFLYGVPVRFGEDEIIGEWEYIYANDCKIELMALEHQCVMRIDTPNNHITEAIFQPGDEALVVKGVPIGRVSKNSPFDTKFYEPYKAVKLKHPGCKVVSRHGRRSKEMIHAHRLVLFNRRPGHLYFN